MQESRIIVVEDDAVIAELIEFNLQNNGYDTRGFRDGPGMLRALPQLMPVSLIILDIMLPGPDGFEICRILKEDPGYETIPVLMLTARSSESDKVRGLMIGADDYLTKPFGIRELMARIQVLIRRYGKSLDRTAEASLPDLSRESLITYGPVLIDDVRHRVYLNGAELEMTNREYELLKFLMQHRGIAYSRDDLLNAVWGYDYSGETRTVDVHIRQLRRKLEADDANPILIETVRGRGYRFTDQPA